MFLFRKMSTKVAKPIRRPARSPHEYAGLEHLDRPELDEDAPDFPRDEWKDESTVRKLGNLARSA